MQLIREKARLRRISAERDEEIAQLRAQLTALALETYPSLPAVATPACRSSPAPQQQAAARKTCVDSSQC